MCDACTAAPLPSARRRLRMVEIDPQWHCTILGTCLTLGELKTLAAKLRIAVETGPNGYKLHAGMVHLASRDNAVAKALTKLLDRKHALAVSRFAKAADEAKLAEMWADALTKGEVASACWAVMSHGAASDELRNAVFQEIHMLSHQVGAATRADLRLIHGLEKDKAELEAKVARQQARLRDEIGRRDQEIRDLRQRLDGEIAESRRLAHASLAARELDGLRRLTAELQSQLAADADRRSRLVEEGRAAQGELQSLRDRLSDALAETARLTDEIQAYETRLTEPTDRVGTCDAACRKLDLCGRCILFVGGHVQHMPHLRRLVEDSNGVFVHHDGGMEQNMHRLHGLFGRADAVLFPVDCVSHSAQDAVKQLCRRWDKPYVPVRRSGLGAYLLALNELSGEATPSR